MSDEEAAACRRAAWAVDAAADARARAATLAQQGWRGPARDAFDADLARVQAEAADLVADLHRAAAALADA